MTFNPATLAGKLLWLRAKDLGAVGSTVASWPDHSGRGRDATGVTPAGLVVAGAATPSGGKAMSVTGASSWFTLPHLDSTIVAVSASSFFSSEPPEGGVDTSERSYWTTNATKTGWLTWQYSASFVASSYQITGRGVSNGARNPRDWTLEGSNDGTTWTVLDTRAGETGWSGTDGEVRTYAFANAVAFDHYRLNVSANNGDSYLSIGGVFLPDAPGGVRHPLGAEAWVVVKADTSTKRALWSLGGTNQQFYPFTDGKIYETFGLAGGARPAFTPTLPLNEWRLYRVSNDGATWAAQLDGVTQATLANAPVAWHWSPKLADSLANARFQNGQIAEVLIRDRVSTSDEIAWLIDYFNTEHGLTVPGGSPPSSGVTGTIAATLPSLTASLSGDVTVPGTEGVVEATLPSLQAHLDGTFTSNDKTGSIAATLPRLRASVAGDITIPPRTGKVDAVLPSLRARITQGIPSVDGTLQGALPSLTAQVVGSAESHSLEPWTADLSRRTLLLLRTTGSIDATPPLTLPPAGVTQRAVVRRSRIVPDLRTIPGVLLDPATKQLRVPDDVYDALPVTEEVVGVPRVMVNFTDVTYFRGSRTLIGTDRAEEPFGDALLSLTFPQITTMDTPGEGDLAWMVDGAPVQLVLQMLEADGVTPSGPILRLWSGDMVSDDDGNDESTAQTTWSCRGSMWQSSSFVHQVPNLLDPTDIGRLVPKAINNVESRRYPVVPYVKTGIMSRERGSWSDSEQAYAQGLLATAYREDGRQWTVGKIPGTVHSYEMRLKKTGSQLTITNGARGVKVDLSRDLSQNRNVIFGRGIGPDGYAWMNTHYPNLRADDAPAYPYASAATVMSIGSADAGTLTGDGVSTWQRKARDLGFAVTVDGVFNTADATATRLLQRHYGITVDGIVGPQTWNETFDVGGNGGDLSGAIRLPLAADPRTQKWVYRADGSISGPNPAFDSTVMIVSDDIDFGTGITRAEGIASAQQIIDREANPPLSGRLLLKSDPREKSRFLIEPGERIALIGYKGADPVLHIVAVERDWQAGEVALEVDQGSRDAMTVAQIRQRNKDARKDPARRPGNVNKRSRLDTDIATPFDGESGAGWVPRHALYAGLWTVIRIPVSQLGRIAKIDLTTTGPHAKFAVALFGSPITSTALSKYVGNPLAASDPFGAHADTLIDRYGFIEGWGQEGQAAGYYPGSEGDGALTGRLVDTGGVEYVSQRPPWVWVAEYAAVSCFISGRILPAAIQ